MENRAIVYILLLYLNICLSIYSLFIKEPLTHFDSVSAHAGPQSDSGQLVQA